MIISTTITILLVKLQDWGSSGDLLSYKTDICYYFIEMN